MRKHFILGAIFLLGITASQGTNSFSRNDNFHGGRPRSLSWAPGMETIINANGRNLIIPKSNSEYPAMLYRAEADPNRRLFPNGVLDSTKMLFTNFNGDPARTEDFNQQSRGREIQRLLNQGKTPSNYFDANGQTIRHVQVPNSLVRDYLLRSVPENYKSGDRSKFPFGNPDIRNVDTKKSHNQLGVRGEALTRLVAEINKSEVKEGTTYNGRSRSVPLRRYQGRNTAPRNPHRG